MAEWISVLAVFWLLWAVDGVRLFPRRVFSFRLGARRRGVAGIAYASASVPSVSPLSSRAIVADLPLALSPSGLTNEVAGSAGRPAERPTRIRAWRWSEVREVGTAKGFVYINGEMFCADTGHVTAPQLLALARLPPAEREQRIRGLMRRLFMVESLRRRRRLLHARTRWPAVANTLTLTLLAALSVYVAGDVSARLPAVVSARLADALPFLLIGVVVMHIAAVIAAWRRVRRLKAAAPEKRGANLFSALLLPPQALRLRALLADGYFPARHPLAYAVAFAPGPKTAEIGFTALADLRWPLPAISPDPLAMEILGWFRNELESHLTALLRRSGRSVEALLAPPAPDGATSCTFCPRCRDQFVAKSGACPHGVPLRPLPRG